MFNRYYRWDCVFLGVCVSRCSYPSRRLSSRSDAVENCRTCTKYHVRNGIGISMYGMATQAIANAPMAIDDCWSVSKRHTGRSVSIWPIEIAMARHQTVHAHVSKPLSLSLSLKKGKGMEQSSLPASRRLWLDDEAP